MKVKSESEVAQSCRLLATPGTAAHRLLRPWDFPGKSTGVGCPFPPPGALPNSGIEPKSPALAGGFFTTEPPGKPALSR